MGVRKISFDLWKETLSGDDGCMRESSQSLDGSDSGGGKAQDMFHENICCRFLFETA